MKSEMNGKQPTTGNSGSNKPAVTASGRKRAITEKLMGDFGPASTTKYKSQRVEYKGCEDVTSSEDYTSSEDIDASDADFVRGEESNQQQGVQVKQNLTAYHLASLNGAVESNLLVQFKDVLNQVSLDDLNKLKMPVKKNESVSLIKFLILKHRESFVAAAIEIGVHADINCLETILKSTMNIEMIEAVVRSLDVQNIAIPKDLIDWVCGQPKPYGYQLEYIPNLCRDFENYNIKILTRNNDIYGANLLSEFSVIAFSKTYAPTPLAATEEKPSSDIVCIEAAPEKVAQMLESFNNARKNSMPTFEAAKQVVNSEANLVAVPSLSKLRKIYEHNKLVKATIFTPYTTYKKDEENFASVATSLCAVLKNYILTMLQHEKIKKVLWGNVREYKHANESIANDRDFFIEKFAEQYKKYRDATDRNRTAELNIEKPLRATLDVVNFCLKPLPPSIVAPELYSPEAEENKSAPKQMFVPQECLLDEKKLLELMTQIEAQYCADINRYLDQYLINCKQMAEIIATLSDLFNGYKSLLDLRDKSNNNLWRTISDIQSRKTVADVQATFAGLCPEFSVEYHQLNEQRRSVRAILQKHLHNVTIHRRQRALCAPVNKITPPALTMPAYLPRSQYT